MEESWIDCWSCTYDWLYDWDGNSIMGTYGLDAEEVADAMEKAEVESLCEGDFYEETFILGAIEYLKRLKKQGAYIYSEKKKEIKKFKEELER